MTSVQLTEDLEHFIRESVRSGRYASESSVISDALIRLRNATDTNPDSLDEPTASSGSGKKLTKQHLHRHLVKIGLLDPPGGIQADAKKSLDLIDDEGEIVDEVVIRERLIEWLTGFLEK
jgi:putative addiction module CopG family antidote